MTLYQNSTGFGHYVRPKHKFALCQWDAAPACRPGDEYARRMVAEVMRTQQAEPLRVLLLGLGCGTIAAGVIHGLAARGRPLAAFDAVELSSSIVTMANTHFFPSMNACNRSSLVSRAVRVVQADALLLRWEAGVRDRAYTHILVDVPPVYLAHGRPGVTTSFWATLGGLCSTRGSQLIVNTWHDRPAAEALRLDLLNAGWGAVRFVTARHNLVVVSSAWQPWNTPSRWTRMLLLKYNLHIGESALVAIFVLCVLFACCSCALFLSNMCAAEDGDFDV